MLENFIKVEPCNTKREPLLIVAQNPKLSEIKEKADQELEVLKSQADFARKQLDKCKEKAEVINKRFWGEIQEALIDQKVLEKEFFDENNSEELEYDDGVLYKVTPCTIHSKSH